MATQTPTPPHGGQDGGQVSVWCARPGEPPTSTRHADHEHYAASLVKLPLLLAAYRAHARADLDLDATVLVGDEFRSALDGTYRAERGYDNDDEPWRYLGSEVSLRWLCARMMVASSNLATNLVLERVCLDAVATVSPSGLAFRRGIGDHAAAAAGITNSATAAAVGKLLADVMLGRNIDAASRAEILALLDAQQYRDGIPAALPATAVVGNKNGWVAGVLHDAAAIRPDDAPPYVLAVCTTGFTPDAAREAIHAVAAASWENRRSHGSRGTHPDQESHAYR